MDAPTAAGAAREPGGGPRWSDALPRGHSMQDFGLRYHAQVHRTVASLEVAALAPAFEDLTRCNSADSTIPFMRRLAIFAHYDADHRVRRYILFLLEHLRQECEDICFVSTSKLPEAEVDKLAGLCSQVMLKDNTGLDFGMWQYALDRLELDGYDELVLVNSSVFGPIRPLRPIFEQMDGAANDFWGITDNEEISWHLQSYFLVFKRQVFSSPAFRQFWQSVLPYQDKNQVIRSYEVGLTTFLLEAGFKAQAYIPMGLMLSWHVGVQFAYRKYARNPTCYHPISVLEAGSPFVKIELLRDNVGKVDLKPVYRMVEEIGFDMTLIEFDRPPKPNLAYPPWPEWIRTFVRRVHGAVAHTVRRRWRTLSRR